MEVHPAIPKTVSEVINKKCWLDGWLKTQAVELDKLKRARQCIGSHLARMRY